MGTTKKLNHDGESGELLQDALSLHKRYCDNKKLSHNCLGTVTIQRGEIDLDCKLCGQGNHHKWISGITDKAAEIFHAAGMDFMKFNRDTQVKILEEIDRIIKEVKEECSSQD